MFALIKSHIVLYFVFCVFLSNIVSRHSRRGKYNDM